MNKELEGHPMFQMFKDIESGILKICFLNKDTAGFCGDARYAVSNGYIITVFNDCYSFDYVDKIEDENGNVVWEYDFEDPLSHYVPESKIVEEVYGITNK